MYLYDLILGTIPEKIFRLMCSSSIRHNEGTKLYRKHQLTLRFADTLAPQEKTTEKTTEKTKPTVQAKLAVSSLELVGA